MAGNHGQLSAYRDAGLDVLRGLADRLAPNAIRQQQVPALQHVSPKVRFALLALLVGLLRRPDAIFCHQFFACLPAAQPASFVSLADGLDRGLDDARSLLAELRRRTMPADDLVDGQQHWCTP